MARNDYRDATMKVGVWQKDMRIITEFARELDCPTPLFAATSAIYNAAMAQGFAEANPTMDVSGRDSAQKLAILASLAFNVRVEEADIHLEGIDKLDATDIKFADELKIAVHLF